PAHPARAFCGLVPGARADAEWRALQWLERQPPPLILAPDPIGPAPRPGGGARPGGNGDPSRLARQRRPPAPDPAGLCRCRFLWPDAAPSEPTLRALRALAARVPYLGRSTGVALADFAADAGDGDAPEGLRAYRPSTLLGDGPTVRVPYPGYVDALRRTFREGRLLWGGARTITYAPAQHIEEHAPAPRVAEPAPSSARAPFPVFVPFGLRSAGPDGGPLRLEGRSAQQVALSFGKYVRKAAALAGLDPTPAVLHGHGIDDRPHAAYLPLPAYGRDQHGAILGVALALPALDDDLRRAVLSALMNSVHRTPRNLTIESIADSVLEHRPGRVEPITLTARRWTRPSRTWTTVTPVVLDRSAKTEDGIADVIADSCAAAGYPRPASVEVGMPPLQDGAVRMLGHDLFHRLKGKPFRHARIIFDQPVGGPVIIGRGRYLGIGLFSPAP
ncbi:MAG: type I-U CRISPR-associated protein Cas5/Cas6, partial [Frankiaceae bacterium]|nr:type I-U CRISPR-associated protein Cas5/Cas6 [Frankiaceae bacterium]